MKKQWVWLLFFSFVTIGCGSLDNVNRRPYANEVKFIAFTKTGLSNASSIGQKRFESCRGRWQFIVTTGAEPTFSELKREIFEQENVKYMTQVKSIEFGKSGFLRGYTCVAFEGEAFQ